MINSLITILILLVSFNAHALDLSITGSIGLNKGTWSDGYLVSPLGKHEAYGYPVSLTLQIRFTEWKYQPTLSLGYMTDSYEFGTYQAPVQKAEPITISLLGGITTEFKNIGISLPGVYFYGLVGYSYYNPRPSLTEMQPYVFHGNRISLSKHLFSYKLGVYKMWDMGSIKVGPELSLQGWYPQPSFSRCRNFEGWPVTPSIGIRVQF